MVGPHSATLEAALSSVLGSDAADCAKEECMYQLLSFLSSLLEKDDRFNQFVARLFEQFVRYVVTICQYPKSLLASLKLINAYSRYCELNPVSFVRVFLW